MVLGLAPAAHGANRTGRMFTGDRSGDWLYAALHRTGFANQATSLARDDGLALDDAFVSASVRCAPPENKPSVRERDVCQPFLERELALMTNVCVIVALGQFAFDAARRVLELQRQLWPRPRPRFGHGVEVSAGRFTVLGSYHPSQQNTFTGKLTEQMFESVFIRARALLAHHPRASQRNNDVSSPPA